MKKSNIEVLSDLNDFKLFKTTCECTSEDHTIDVIVESISDHSYPMTTLIFKSLIYPKSIWERIKIVLCVLFKGYYDSEEEFIFRDEKHLSDFSSALFHAVKEVKNYNQEQS